MDHLLYKLVEQIVGYLPQKDVETIAKVAKGTRLQSWSAAAEDQLMNRFLLDVHVVVGQTEKEGGGPRTRLLCTAVRKDKSQEVKVEWNLTEEEGTYIHIQGRKFALLPFKWRYAWIRSLHVETVKGHNYIGQAEMDQVLRVVSLPVEPNIQYRKASLTLNHKYDRGSLGIDRAMARTWRILQATQKEFVTVELDHAEHDPPGVVEEFVADFIKRGVFLEELEFRKIAGQTHMDREGFSLKFDGGKRDLDFLKPWNIRVDIKWYLRSGHFTGIDDWLKSVVYGRHCSQDLSHIISLEKTERDELAL
uniref:F-box domain-containing protein n=1 Tax=Steinernema glaseri TaxID=37863 RepID=A0A1I7YVE8_9BILA